MEDEEEGWHAAGEDEDGVVVYQVCLVASQGAQTASVLGRGLQDIPGPHSHRRHVVLVIRALRLLVVLFGVLVLLVLVLGVVV